MRSSAQITNVIMLGQRSEVAIGEPVF